MCHTDKRRWRLIRQGHENTVEDDMQEYKPLVPPHLLAPIHPKAGSLVRAEADWSQIDALRAEGRPSTHRTRPVYYRAEGRPGLDSTPTRPALGRSDPDPTCPRWIDLTCPPQVDPTPTRPAPGRNFWKSQIAISLSDVAICDLRLKFLILSIHYLCPGATQVGPRDRKITVRLMALNAVWVRDPLNRLDKTVSPLSVHVSFHVVPRPRSHSPRTWSIRADCENGDVAPGCGMDAPPPFSQFRCERGLRRWSEGTRERGLSPPWRERGLGPPSEA